MYNSTPEHQAAINTAGASTDTATVTVQPTVVEPHGASPPAGQPGQIAASPPIGQTQASGAPSPSPNEPLAGQPTGQPQQDPPGPVPYDRFAQINNERNQLQSHNAMLQQQMALYQANAGRAAPSIEQEQGSGNTLGQLAESIAGIKDDDGLYGKEARALVEGVSSAVNQLQAQVGAVSFLTQNPDFSQVVGTAEQIADPLQYMLNTNPMLEMTIRSSPDPIQAALIAGREGARQLQTQATQQPQQGQPQQGMPVQSYSQQQQFYGQPTLPGAPGPGNMTPVMAGQAPPSISNFHTGTGVNDQNRWANASDEDIVAFRQANRLGGG